MAFWHRVLVYRCLHGSAPCYLQQTVCPVANMESRRRLRSVTSSDLMVPATRRSTLQGDRAFAVAGPRAWNNLPDAISHSPSLETFKRSLKSHLFLLCFLLSLSFLVFMWHLWLCTAPLKWLCVIYGTLQIDYFYIILHYIVTWPLLLWPPYYAILLFTHLSFGICLSLDRKGLLIYIHTTLKMK